MRYASAIRKRAAPKRRSSSSTRRASSRDSAPISERRAERRQRFRIARVTRFGRSLAGPSLVMIALLLILVAPPLWFVLSGSVIPDDGSGFTLRYYQNLIANPGLLQSVLNSLLFAVFSAVAALLIG